MIKNSSSNHLGINAPSRNHANDDLLLSRSSIFLLFLSSLAAQGESPAELQREIVLNPDPHSEETAYAQIRKSFGEKSIESPDLFAGNHQNFTHIQIRDDHEAGGCFDFFLHRDLDGDRNKEWPLGKSRQRNEIKGYGGSDEGLKATEGQVTRYTWLFRVNEGMTLTQKFCHFFQLKAVGGNDIATPLFTISGSRSGERDQLELRLQTSDHASWQRIPVCDWNVCQNQWLSCEIIVRFHEEGYLRARIESRDGSISFMKEFPEIDTWREGSEFVRPKWGIYRSLEDRESILQKEDVVSFSQFRIQEWSKLSSVPSLKRQE